MALPDFFNTLREIAYGPRASADGESRMDGWYNPSTGMGTSIDRAAATAFVPDLWLDPWTLSNLFHFNDICARIVSLPPNEALRRPWELHGPEKARHDAHHKKLDLARKLRRGAKWGRCFGGGLGVMWVNDGRAPDQPVERGRAYEIRDLTIYDRRSVERVARIDDEGDGTFAHARMFRVMPAYGGEFRVHRDRCLVFGGEETGDFEREALGGWDASVLQIVYNVIASFESGYLSLGNLLTDFSQPVITMKGLIKALGQKGGRDALTTRAQVMNLGRSIARALFLDADAQEKYERVSAAFTGIPESLDRLGNRLALATGIPVSILMGQAPAGLGVTGDSDVRAFYATCAAYRRDAIEPLVDRVLELSAPGHTVTWPTLWEPSDKEQADARLAVANADAIYLDRDVYTPEEVAAARTKPLDVKPNMRARKAIRTPELATNPKPQGGPAPTPAAPSPTAPPQTGSKP